MSNIFGERLKAAMREHDEYHEYNGKRKCTHRYRYIDLARDIGSTENTIKSWAKKNGTAPTMDNIKRVSKVLGVDAAYLIGEQDYKRHKDQTICDVTHLNEQSAKFLAELGDDSSEISRIVLDELLNHKDFKRLLLLIFEYTHLQNIEIKFEEAITNEEYTSPFENAHKEMMKYRPVDTFSNILENIYDAHTSTTKDVKIYRIIEKMINEVQEYLPICEDSPEGMDILLRLIKRHQDDICKLDSKQPICEFTPEEIIDNFDLIKGTI